MRNHLRAPSAPKETAELTECLDALQEYYECCKPPQLFVEEDLHFNLKKALSSHLSYLCRQTSNGPGLLEVLEALLLLGPLSSHPHDRAEHQRGFLISNVGGGSHSDARTAQRSGSNSPAVRQTEEDSSQFAFCLFLKLMQISEPQETSIMSKCVC